MSEENCRRSRGPRAQSLSEARVHYRREGASESGGLRRRVEVGPISQTLAVLMVFLLLAPAQVAAYIDPITGSIILQVLAAAALGALLTIKRVWAGLLEGKQRVWRQMSKLWER